MIQFPESREEKYLDEMTREELEEYLTYLKSRVETLEGKEPKSMNSEAYELWAEEHEVLEDAIDEVRELLDEF